MRISAEQRRQNELRIRTAMDRLLRGEIPPDGRCDIKTLAREANVDRTAFYGTRPYAHLREEFEQRRHTLHTSGEQPDPRDAQIDRLKTELDSLTQRLAQRDQTLDELTDLNERALSRLAAQHDEITRLRQQTASTSSVRRLPTSSPTIGPCS